MYFWGDPHIDYRAKEEYNGQKVNVDNSTIEGGAAVEQTYLSGTIQVRIREQLKIKDMNQAQLARIIGIGESTFSRFMSCGESAKLDHQYVIRIAREFNVSTDFLLGITNVPDRKNYRIDELGLSPMAARNLYIGRVNTHVVSYLLENPKFAFTTNRIARYL